MAKKEREVETGNWKLETEWVVGGIKYGRKLKE